MARAKLGSGFNREKFEKFVSRISETKQALDDARAEHGQEYRQLEEAGAHRQAFKLAARLQSMDVGKRNDFLASLQVYCDWLGIWDQGNLFEEPHIPQGATLTQETSLPEAAEIPVELGDVASESVGDSEGDELDDARRQGYHDGVSGLAPRHGIYEADSPERAAYLESWGEGQSAAVYLTQPAPEQTHSNGAKSRGPGRKKAQNKTTSKRQRSAKHSPLTEGTEAAGQA